MTTETPSVELTHFLCVGSNCWAKAETVFGARKKWRAQGGRGEPSIYRIPEDYWIDDMGSGHGSAKAQLYKGEDIRD
jgi:hypothetical protein